MSFVDLGICKELCDVCQELGWKKPTEIQSKVIPVALKGKDIVGLAETGSGKTAAFALPILQNLLIKPRFNYALILTPTRELAMQIRQHFMGLGSRFGLKVLCLVGGQHIEDQQRTLKQIKHHIIIGTPGRIVFHIENSKELILHKLRYFVLDEADNMLSGNFDSQLETILSRLPEKRKNYMFSATMSGNLEKIQSACLRMPVRLETSKKYTTVENLDHAFVFLPDQRKDIYVAKLLVDLGGSTTSESRTIVFVATSRESIRLGEVLRFITSKDRVVILNGLMRQEKRVISLDKFKSGEANIMVSTDLASRGLDIPEVQLVINYDVPGNPTSWSEAAKAYIHRVGRTARAGRPGRAITLVTPYSVTRLRIIESVLGSQIPQLAWVDPTRTDSQFIRLIDEASVHAKSILRRNDKRQKQIEARRSKKRRLGVDGGSGGNDAPSDDSDVDV